MNRTSGAKLLNDSIGFGITTRVREIYNLHNTRLPLNPLFRVPFWGMELAVNAGCKFLYYDLVKKKKI